MNHVIVNEAKARAEGITSYSVFEKINEKTIQKIEDSEGNMILSIEDNIIRGVSYKIGYIGFEPKGKKSFFGAEYKYSEEELKQLKAGILNPASAALYLSKHMENKYIETKVVRHYIIHKDSIKEVSIFYDIEDDYRMEVTYHLKDGRKFLNITRDKNEKEILSKHFPLKESYGY